MSEFRYRAAFRVVLTTTICVALLSAAGQPWLTKLSAQWTEEDALQVLSDSPWVKQITAGIAGRLTEDQLREGGVLGQPHGPGYDGVDPKGSGPKVSPNIFTGPGGDDRSARSLQREVKLKMFWESALPVRLAGLKAHRIEPPTLEGDGYQIAVYGLPGAYFKEDPKQLGDPLKAGAALKREGKKDAKPVRVEVFQREDGLAVVYLFPLSAEIGRRDGWVQFEAHIGRIYITQIFNLKDMEFLGELAL